MPKLYQFDLNFYNQGYSRICGIDEVGRGALAGPVVAGAVLFEKEIFIDGVKDSKKLTPHRREELFNEIIINATSWSVGIVNNQDIDRVNILEATKQAMLASVNYLEIEPEFILIDGRKWKDFPYNHEFVIKGDSKSFCIASASIIAKVIRDRIMVMLSDLYPEYKFHENKGYGTRAHVLALSKHGPTSFHRRSFKPVYQPELIF